MTDRPTRVWDLPVRLFHWSLVLLVAFQFYSGNVGGNLMRWHMLSGYTILALVLFRIAWGLGGSTTARFAYFLSGPQAAFAFARRLFSRAPAPYAGHNPIGGWMVIALLAALALQAASGLFANDDIATEGPLAVLVSKATSDRMTAIHRATFVVLAVLTALHVCAVLYHWLVKKEDLIGAMFTGVRRLPEDVAQRLSAARFESLWRALGLIAAACVLVWLVVSKTFLKP